MGEQTVKPYTEGQEKFGTWLINSLGRWQVRIYEASGGKLWNTFRGSKVAILTVTGRKTGLKRKIPLLYLPWGDNVVMTASKGGMSKAPIWYHNLLARPEAEIQIGASKKTYRMREANAEEESELWPQLESMYSDYVEYRQRVEGVRPIPVLVFEPINPTT